jgi:uncharacterized protein YjbJ (UPF0337 family)
MNREHMKGAFAKAKGAMKNAIGKMTGNKKTQTEGKWDKAKARCARKPVTLGTR